MTPGATPDRSSVVDVLVLQEGGIAMRQRPIETVGLPEWISNLVLVAPAIANLKFCPIG